MNLWLPYTIAASASDDLINGICTLDKIDQDQAKKCTLVVNYNLLQLLIKK